MIESLEPRQLLAATGTPWITAPFGSRIAQPQIYQNERGYAVITGTLNARHPFGAYNLSSDDAGTINLETSGSIATDLAYYADSGPPSDVDASGSPAGASLSGLNISGDKPSVYVAVRAHTAGASGAYELQVHAPPANFLPALEPSSAPGNGAAYTSITGTNDCDFYAFTVPSTGSWTAKVLPDANLDVTMNVYDQKGNPVGGTFTSAIDDAGAGGAERWTGINLVKGSVYFIRIDGVGYDMGYYHVLVQSADPPLVGVTATTATAGVGKNGRFTVSRTGDITQPLTIHYALSGTARAGVDYAALSGVLTFAANQSTSTIAVDPISTITEKQDKTVVLSLVSGSRYALGAGNTAVLTLLAHKASK